MSGKENVNYKMLRMNIDEGNLNFRVAKDGLRTWSGKTGSPAKEP
jgi:hypothetical protein